MHLVGGHPWSSRVQTALKPRRAYAYKPRSPIGLSWSTMWRATQADDQVAMGVAPDSVSLFALSCGCCDFTNYCRLHCLEAIRVNQSYYLRVAPECWRPITPMLLSVRIIICMRDPEFTGRCKRVCINACYDATLGAKLCVGWGVRLSSSLI